jgi:hypothetical protein
VPVRNINEKNHRFCQEKLILKWADMMDFWKIFRILKILFSLLARKETELFSKIEGAQSIMSEVFEYETGKI